MERQLSWHEVLLEATFWDTEKLSTASMTDSTCRDKEDAENSITSYV